MAKCPRSAARAEARAGIGGSTGCLRGRRSRTPARDGLTRVIGAWMNSSIAAAELNRRQPMTTLDSSPVLKAE